MGHITFVHGIANKTDPDTLLSSWRAALVDDDGLDLDDLGVTVSMVYWADILYGAPLPSSTARESNELELVAAAGAEDADPGWVTGLPGDEQAFVAALAKQLGLDPSAVALPAADGESITPGSDLEAIPLPGWLKIRLMRVLLRDVHHYLFDAEFSPRPGETYRVRRDVRARALAVLQADSERGGPHVLVGHSLGSVIAYDLLTSVEETPPVDALVTCGSPLGIAEVQQRLAPPWTKADGWPTRRLADGPWRNVYDIGDPVCAGWRARLAGFYQRSSSDRVDDRRVTNSGSWRHSVDKYLGQHTLRDALYRALTA